MLSGARDARSGVVISEGSSRVVAADPTDSNTSEKYDRDSGRGDEERYGAPARASERATRRALPVALANQERMDAEWVSVRSSSPAIGRLMCAC